MFRSPGVAFTRTRILLAVFASSPPLGAYQPPLPRPFLLQTTLRPRFCSAVPLTSTPPSRRRSSILKQATPFSLIFRRHCSHEALQARSISTTANMADRDILPDSFKPVHYDLVIKNLDFKNWSYTGTVRCVFESQSTMTGR